MIRSASFPVEVNKYNVRYKLIQQFEDFFHFLCVYVIMIPECLIELPLSDIVYRKFLCDIMYEGNSLVHLHVAFCIGFLIGLVQWDIFVSMCQ